MIIRKDWVLSPIETLALPRSYGLALVKDLHERIELTLGDEEIPSTRFSGLIGARSQSNFITLEKGQTYRLSLSGLSESASEAIYTLELGNEINLLGGRFAVCERSQQSTTYEALYQQQVGNEPEPIYRHNLRFETPTAFSQRRLSLPLPVPELMLRSWLTTWNHFASVYLGGDELIGYLSEVVAVSRHQLRTSSIQIHKGWVVGFTGDVTFTVLNRADSLLAQVCSLLVAYAEFSGTGMKTRLGMGRTRLI
jgi:CRISPR-associated endoribonuclease Cas6